MKTTSLSLEVGAPKEFDSPFIVEEDPENKGTIALYTPDQKKDRYPYLGTLLAGDGNNFPRPVSVGLKDTVPLTGLLRLGVKFLKVYSSLPVEIRALDPIDEEELDLTKNGPSVSDGKHVKVKISKNVSVALDFNDGYDGRQVVKVGAREELVKEVLQFSGERAKTIKHWSAYTDLAVVHSSEFVNEEGSTIAPPTLHSNGEFRAIDKVYGAIYVEYKIIYDRYAVYYTVDSPGTEITHVSGSSFIQERHRPSAPMTILATSGNRTLMLQVDRPYNTITVANFLRSGFIWELKDRDKEEDEQEAVYTEYDRREVLKLILDEDSGNSVEVSQVVEVYMKDPSGYPLTLRLKDLP